MISAPGKLMLLGDYAVLAGGVAVVAAVNRRAGGELEPEGVTSMSPVVRAVLARAKEAGYEAPTGVRIDTSTFHDQTGSKLGLGSSAVVAVITAALATGKGDDETLRIAVDGHRDAAGGKGSGVDVAACFSGGVIACLRQPGPIEPLPSQVRGLHLSVLYTGTAASTPKLVGRVQASDRWPRWAEILEELTEEGVEAWKKQDSRRFLSVVSKYGRAMASMGKDADAPVVTEQIEAVMDAADARGAAAKPSGAGGGDVVVMWSEQPAIAEQIAADTGCEVVDIAVDPRGLSRKG